MNGMKRGKEKKLSEAKRGLFRCTNMVVFVAKDECLYVVEKLHRKCNWN